MQAVKPQYEVLAPVLARAIREKFTGPWQGTMEDLLVFLGTLDVSPQPAAHTLGSTLIMISPLLEREGWQFTRSRTRTSRLMHVWPPEPARLTAGAEGDAGAD